MFKTILHHHASSCSDCTKLCCTKIEDFSVKIGRLTIFDHVNIHIHCGQLTALIGPNGAGKSTLLKAILGEVPHGGSLHYVDAKGKHTGHPVIGYVPQYLRFDVSSPTSVMDIFMACLTRRPVWLCSAKSLRPRVLRSLERVRAAHLIDRRLGALSGGELQRVLLALALDPMPDLLLLDEPALGLAPLLVRSIFDSVRKINRQGVTVILVEQNARLALQVAHRGYVLATGEIILYGPARELAENPEVQKAYLGEG